MIYVISYLIPFLVWVGLVVLFVRRAVRGVRLQAILSGLLLCALAKFAVFAAFGENPFSPELPEKVIWILNFAYSGAMILFPLALLARVFRLKGLILFSLLPIAWGFSARGLWNGIKVPDVREVVIDYPNLPSSLDGYRIVQLSDLHVSAAARRHRTEEIVKRVNALEPDLVCLTGDLVDGPSHLQAMNLAPIAALKAKDGVWAVAGNHEYYFDRLGYRCVYSLWGLRFLDNACVFPRPELALVGVPDRAADRWSEELPNAERAFANVPKECFKLLLEHRPENARRHANEHGVDLQLSGHTHGGVMPGLAQLVALMNGGFVRGLYSTSDRNQYLYVSSGTGQWAGFPIRFFNDPEITLITLRRTGVAP